jgi:hypothetical protein
MIPEQATKAKEEALRQSQLDLYHLMQETMNEIANEMLGETQWKTVLVDRSFQELMDELVDHFGMENSNG